MKPPLLVLDCHYLCHRAFHSQGHLSFRGAATGVVFGFLKTILEFKEEFHTDRIAFCFESKVSYRKIIYPEYKAKRSQVERSPEEQAAYKEFRQQIDDLRKEHLPRIGFKNIFRAKGYESDDLMAAIARDVAGEVVLVTADSDMYQCLHPWVRIYNPAKGTIIDEHWFVDRYNIHPKQWASVKAIGGCATDGVKGVKGVGEATALKYIRGLLTRVSVERILAAKDILDRNRKLVKLPFAGCPSPVIRKDSISRAGWRETCAKLGMSSLGGRPPIYRQQAV